MVEHLTQPPDEMDAARLALVEAAVEHFEEVWQVVSEPELSEFLPSSNELVRGEALVQLVKVDLWHRWRSRHYKTLEQYLQEWPDLSEKPDCLVELLTAECLSRAAFDRLPSREELQARFPHVAELVDLQAVTSDVQGLQPTTPQE